MGQSIFQVSYKEEPHLIKISQFKKALKINNNFIKCLTINFSGLEHLAKFTQQSTE